MRLPRWWLRLCVSTSEGTGWTPGWGPTCHVAWPKKIKGKKYFKKNKSKIKRGESLLAVEARTETKD